MAVWDSNVWGPAVWAPGVWQGQGAPPVVQVRGGGHFIPRPAAPWHLSTMNIALLCAGVGYGARLSDAAQRQKYGLSVWRKLLQKVF